MNIIESILLWKAGFKEELEKFILHTKKEKKKKGEKKKKKRQKITKGLEEEKQLLQNR